MQQRGRSETHLIAVVEDPPGFADDLCGSLEAAGCLCRRVGDERCALPMIRQDVPDLVLVTRNGSVTRCGGLIVELKHDPATADVPIVLMIPQGDSTEELVAFALGADECLVKSVSARILLARITALLQRATSRTGHEQALQTGPLYVDYGARITEVDGESVPLTPTEFLLLWSIVAEEGRVVSRRDLLKTVFGTLDTTDRRIDVHMTSLRKKLGPAATWVQTVRGFGYACRSPNWQESRAPHTG